MINQTGVGMKLNMAFTLVYKDKDGNVLGTSEAKGQIPFDSLTEQQQETIIKEIQSGTHN